MRTRTTCPTCGALLRVKRFGVRLSPLKAQLLDIVKASGIEGITPDGLLSRLPIRGAKRHRTLNVHISQINDKLETTKWRIISQLGYRVLVSKKALPKELKSALTQ